MIASNYITNYNLSGDLASIIIGVLVMIMLRSTYSLKDRKYKFFHAALGIVIIAALCRIQYMYLLRIDTQKYRTMIVALRTFYYMFLSIVLNLYLLYIMELVKTKDLFKRIVQLIAGGGYIAFAIRVQMLSRGNSEFFIEEDGNVIQVERMASFYGYYFLMIVLITISLFVYKKKMITKVRNCIINGTILALVIVGIQMYFFKSSLLTFTFMLPIVMVCFIFHNHGRDIVTGTLDYRSFLAYYEDYKDEELAYIALYLDGVSQEKILTLSEYFYHFNEEFFKGNSVFQLDDNRFLMICKKRRNEKFQEIMPRLLESFMQLYEQFSIDFKIIWGEQKDAFSSGREFYSFFLYQEDYMTINSVKKIERTEYEAFEKVTYLVQELADIHRKKDLDDPRVRVFCQPVLNTETRKYSTAEALMRLETEKYGMVFPDMFIGIAEKNDCIHTLSEIILHKTCKFIQSALKEGKEIERISVNISAMELKNRNFCQDIIQIIEECEIPFEKIAIELTESTNEADFQRVKEVMFELQKYGIKFYLDDFGTGYSNIERIIGLPIDIIKFDRSLTILAGRDETSQSIVASFSNIFEMAEYQVLFEGIEDDADETRCMEMNADYLQGYKYSKPIPIEELRRFI